MPTDLDDLTKTPDSNVGKSNRLVGDHDSPPVFADRTQPLAAESGKKELAARMGAGGQLQALTDQRVEDASKSMAGLKGREISALEAEERRRMGAAGQDYQRIKQAYNAEGVGADALRPWNAKAETEAHTTDPIHLFGNAATLTAVLASAFTRTPAISAMNGMAAAIGAIKQGDQEGYERAHQAWKENTELALKRLDLQHRAFEDAIELAKANPASGETAFRTMIAKFGMEQDQLLLEKGMYPEFLQLQDHRAEAAAKLRASMARIDRVHGLKIDTVEGMQEFLALPKEVQNDAIAVMNALRPHGAQSAKAAQAQDAADKIEQLRAGKTVQWGGLVLTPEDYQKAQEKQPTAYTPTPKEKAFMDMSKAASSVQSGPLPQPVKISTLPPEEQAAINKLDDGAPVTERMEDGTEAFYTKKGDTLVPR